ncbi:MAG: DUF2628 domain-containing protein [Ruminococcus sp.]|nr:DUF2628 domain-containing protein [Ruminococcus sp.]
MNYIDEKCVLCGEVFSGNDDVVVCPECGAPHHRECFKKNGSCAATDLHAEGKKWQRTVTPFPTAAAGELTICPVCRTANRLGNQKCIKCGERLETEKPEIREHEDSIEPNEEFSPFTQTAEFLGFDPEEDMGGATIRELSQFVDSNTIYYIPLFKRFKELGTKLSLNLLCFIFPPVYFANRRMWGWAMISSVIMVLLAIPAFLSYMINDSMREGYFFLPTELTNLIYDNRHYLNALIEVCSIGDLITRLSLCLFCNHMYMRFAVRTLQKIKLRTRRTVLSRECVSAAGGVKPINSILILILMGIMAYAAIIGTVFILYIAFAITHTPM